MKGKLRLFILRQDDDRNAFASADASNFDLRSKILLLDNKNKCKFILCCTHLIVSLQSETNVLMS